MPRIAIIGPGAIGSVMVAWLGHSGHHEIVLCARRPLGAIRVETPGGELTVQPEVITDPTAATPVDWILVTTKAYDSAGAATWFAGLGATGAPVAILQNGVEHRERFSAFVPADRLVPVMVDCPAERLAPTHVRQRGPAKMAVADDGLGRAFAALFAGTDVAIDVVSDFQSVAWRKLCLNAAGVLSALLLQPAGIMRDEGIGEVARQLVRETIAVGRAEGATLDDTIVETVLQAYRAAPTDAINSLHADRIASRPMELDARNGVIVRLGRKHGIPTPGNQMAVALMQAMVGGKR